MFVALFEGDAWNLDANMINCRPPPFINSQSSEGAHNDPRSLIKQR